MRGCWVLLLLTSALPGCGDGQSEAERAERNRLAVEAVERVNNAPPPVDQIVPQPILYSDLERYELYTQTCAYAPGTSLGARAIAREADAFIKLDGEMLRFAADPGSRELPLGTRSLYDGRAYILQLSIHGEEDGSAQGLAAGRHHGTMRVLDRWDRVVYEGSGTVMCTG